MILSLHSCVPFPASMTLHRFLGILYTAVLGIGKLNQIASRKKKEEKKMDDEKLILLVQQRSAIFDKRDKLHHNRDYILKQWETIAQEMQSDVNTCKNRWGHLRDYFLKKLREMKTFKSGQAPSNKKKWHLYDAMSFLVTFYDPRETSGNLPETAAVIDDSSQSQPSQPQTPTPSSSPSTRSECPTPPPALPLKRNPKRKPVNTGSSEVDEELLKTLREPEDEDELWARSLLPSIHRLGHLEKMEFRTEVQSLLIKYLRRGENARPITFTSPGPGPCEQVSSDYYTTYETYQSDWPQEMNQ